MSLDTEVLIIGGGMSGLGLAVQLTRHYGSIDYEIIEKADAVGGTWTANTYPGCGCDVASHFYSYSFELNPDWSQKYSMQPEIQRYFRGVAEKYDVVPHIKLHSMVESATWEKSSSTWIVTIRDTKTQQIRVRRSKILTSAVGSLSVPKKCDTPGYDSFDGPIFHSAQWDHSFDWKQKDVVVLGNGCSATQFVPIMTKETGAVKQLTQFSRQAQYLAERENPEYSSAFKATMRYVPLAMRLYRSYLYWLMERDFAGFEIEGGKRIRADLAKDNVAYVKKMAPERYWDALIPKTEIGCKRKVLDTGYLECLHRSNMELVSNDPVAEITSHGVRTKSGREVHADAIVLAIGFATTQMLFPMKIVGESGATLEEYWKENSKGVAQAYFGTCVPDFPNFFILMGPNTVTGHLSVIYTVECQINFMLRLLHPIIKTLPSQQRPRILPSLSLTAPDNIIVKARAAMKDSAWIQAEAKRLVWASGCTNWALDEKTGMNVMMYPDFQYFFWLRSIFYRKNDFEYRKRASSGEEKKVAVVGNPWRMLGQLGLMTGVLGAGLITTGLVEKKAVEDAFWDIISHARSALKQIRL